MTVSSISSVTNLYQTYQADKQRNSVQVQQEFQAVGTSLQSGDLSGAQKAFADLQQLMSNPSATDQTQNPVAVDLNAIGQALQSGDLSGAQADFTKLQQDVQVQGHHHPHHHHNASSSTTGIQTDNGQQGQNPITSDLNSVGQALQSGDLSDAQSAFAKLEQDMLSVQGYHHYHHQASAGVDSTASSASGSSETSENIGSALNVSA